MNSNIQIETTLHIDDKTGREIVTFTPFFTPDVTASGKLTFASWQAWADDSTEAIEKQKHNAISNAITCMLRFAEDLSQ